MFLVLVLCCSHGHFARDDRSASNRCRDDGSKLLGRLTDPNYIPADFEYGPGGINDPAARARIAEYRAETARMHGLEVPEDGGFISASTDDDLGDWDAEIGGDVEVIGDNQAELVDREMEDEAMLAKAREVKESSPELEDLDAQTRQQIWK